MISFLRRRPASAIAALALISVVALAWGVQICGSGKYRETGDSYPGVFTATTAVAGYFVGACLGALVLGALIYVIVAARPGRDGSIDVGTFRAHQLIERSAPAWAVVSLAMMVITAADRAGLPVGRLAEHASVLRSLIDASEQAIAWGVAAVCAAVIAVCARFGLSWTSHVPLLLPAAIGVVALPVAGNAGQGPNHDYGTAAAIVFALAVAMSLGVRLVAAMSARDTAARDVAQTARRVRHIVMISNAVALIYALVLGVILVSPGRLTSAFGVAALVVVAGLALLLGIDLIGWRRGGFGGSAVLAVGVGFAVYAGIAVADTRTATALLAHRFTAWDVYLGYRLTHAPSPASIAGMWRFDLLIAVAAVVAIVLYAIGVRRLGRAGTAWSRWRTLSWMLGCVSLIVTSSSGLRTYGMAMFSVHMVEHMVLNMFIPVLLVLGAPVTLALQALPTAAKGALPGPREWITRVLHSPLSRFLTHPIVSLILFVVSLYGVYFTSLFDVLVRYHWGHEAMSIHFLVTGYLFYWSIIGIDPGPRRLPFLARLGVLFAVMPFHAFFGIATMTMSTIIGGDFYRRLDLPWVTDLQHDQFLGGAIAWGTSEVPVIIVVIALVSQWMTTDRRAAARADRHADRYADTELEAYNEMLAELARSRR